MTLEWLAGLTRGRDGVEREFPDCSSSSVPHQHQDMTMKQEQTHAELVEYLRLKYPHHVTMKNEVDPRTVSPERFGHHGSFVLHAGLRTWCFATEEGRAEFIEAYRNNFPQGEQ